MENQYNVLTDESLEALIIKTKTGLNNKVDKIDGKSLSENDLTTVLKNSYDNAVKDIAALKSDGAEANKIDTVKVNGNALTPDTSKAVDISVPTTAQIKAQIEAYGYQTATQVDDAITAKGYQTSAQVNTAIEDKGYQTATQVNTAIEGKGYQTATQVQEAINNAVGDVTSFEQQVVDELPTTGEKGVIYLVLHSHGDKDSYDEYIWVATTNTFEKIGNTDMDLSDYVKSTDLVEVDATKIDELWDSVTV